MEKKFQKKNTHKRQRYSKKYTFFDALDEASKKILFKVKNTQ